MLKPGELFIYIYSFTVKENRAISILNMALSLGFLFPSNASLF
ncbi:hypothetical protein C900_03910 [Fulvivirga imtechensis AK7]|uniref:Uncharacterized protein n=1 Tax=Fulvivirga imtechensis AK7 TaxID=1237149 RepID=L8JN14_9BACT|nr:hypothetical protein C900_03910 [Fulvivirga imtechensis AK7]